MTFYLPSGASDPVEKIVIVGIIQDPMSRLRGSVERQ